MKHTSKIALGLVSLFALAACAGGSEVDAAKFQEEARKVEAHTYTQATVKYSSSMEFLGKKEEGKGEIKYTRGDDGAWTTESEDENAQEYMGRLDVNIVGFSVADSVPTDELPQGFEFETKYYVNPFKITFNLKGAGETSDATGNTNGSGEFKFDKYGYMTYSTFNFDIDGTFPLIGEMSMKMSEKLEISYK